MGFGRGEYHLSFGSFDEKIVNEENEQDLGENVDLMAGISQIN